ncbi:unnamed protein product [Ceutorhynchus assimilis]|uniref:Anoctamin n=1 Tax=Ceutorhynchus assimilis TaxID=467358 RepID=A0A9N9QQA8_9CUCU|nr:unnamed protein product [Ceutorhynchus assimilis]
MATSRVTKRPDFVLVVKEKNLPFLEQYFNNLRALGLDFANEPGQTVDLIFIKVFISKEALAHFSELYEIGRGESRVTTVFYTEVIFRHIFPTPLSDMPLDNSLERTEADNIMIVDKVLQNARYGSKDTEFGLSNLISMGIVETGYPLHDGSIEQDGMNIRSKLYRHWSNLRVTHMEQPLDLIFRYFGNEVAFYFAWFDYFNIMLVLPSILGALVVLAGLIYVALANPAEVREICETSEVLCPVCEGWPGCRYKEIQKFCALAHWSYVFDNNFTIAFAVFMTFWCTLFITLWRRKENTLMMRWNCENVVEETQIRQAYLASTTHQRPNGITGEMEPYVPKICIVLKYSVTIAACTILLAIILLAVIIVMVLKILFTEMCQASENLYLRSHSRLLTMILGSAVQVTVIKIFQLLYRPASIRLTEFENPRTQVDFDNSVLYKKYLLSFMNNYIPVIYLAFVKGKVTTLPHHMNFLTKDSCQPINCVVSLCIQLTFIMTVKTFLGNVFNVVFTKAKLCLRFFSKRYAKRHDRYHPSREDLPQWEKEYYLEPLTRYFVLSEFSEMGIKYHDIYWVGFLCFPSHTDEI